MDLEQVFGKVTFELADQLSHIRVWSGFDEQMDVITLYGQFD